MISPVYGVKILFDQGTPVPLRHALRNHEVVTAFERGWDTLQNGDLLQAAESEGFTAIVTTDQNLRHQQNLSVRQVGIVILMTTSWPLIRQHVDQVATAIATITPGACTELHFPPPG